MFTIIRPQYENDLSTLFCGEFFLKKQNYCDSLCEFNKCNVINLGGLKAKPTFNLLS